MIIGLSGYAQSGKDTAAHELAAHGYQRRAFADKLKDLAYALNPTLSGSPLQSWVKAYGWEEAKKTAEVRAYLQTVGVTHREVLWPDVWVDALFNGLDSAAGDYVITDVRFPNEARAVAGEGGYVIRIERPGTGPVNGHISESALDGWPFDATVVNDGTPAELAAKILAAVNA